MGGGWVLEIDVRKFFDTLEHGHLRAILRRRVRDGVLLRLLGKWLKAGILEEGNVSFLQAGSPQGGVISPMLANIYLHEVLDVWFVRDVQPRLRGRAHLVRYADDGAPRRRRKEARWPPESSLAVQEMRVGPSKPPCRRRLQTTASGDGQKPWS